MPSEYDFLLPYSRRVRRAGRAALIAGAFGLGVGCAALVIALPMRSGERQVANAVDARGKEASAKPVAASSRPKWDWAKHSAPRATTGSAVAASEPNSATESTALGFGGARETTGTAPSAPAGANPSATTPPPSRQAAIAPAASTEIIPEPRPRPAMLNSESSETTKTATAEAAEPTGKAVSEQPEAPKQAAAESAASTKTAAAESQTSTKAATEPSESSRKAAAQPTESSRKAIAEPADSTRKAAAEASNTTRKATPEPTEAVKRATNGNGTRPAPSAVAPAPPRQPNTATAPEETRPAKPENRPTQTHRIRTATHETHRSTRGRDEDREMSRSRESERRVARSRDDSRSRDDGLASTREFVDRSGVRHIFLPRQMTARERDVFYGGRPRPFFSLGRAAFDSDD